MSEIQLAPRRTTVLWEGDVIVLGSTFAGLAAAVAARHAGLRVCLLEPGPVLGTELSAEWLVEPPTHPIVDRIRALAGRMGAPVDDAPLDVVLGTIACDQLIAEDGVEALVKVVPGRILTDDQGHLTGLEVVGKSGRQWVKAPRLIDALPGQRFLRRMGALDPLPVKYLARRLYVAGLAPLAGRREWSVPGVSEALFGPVVGGPAAWPGEAILTVRFTAESVDESARLLQTLDTAAAVFAELRRTQPEFADATLVEISPVVSEEFAVESPALSLSGTTGFCAVASRFDAVARMTSGEELADTTKTPILDIVGTMLSAPEGETIASFELEAAPEQDLPSAELPAARLTVHEPRDVVVAGYGTGGAFAALAAARSGVDTVVLDPAPVPGGIGSAGRIHSYYHGLPGGMQDRLDEIVRGHTLRLAPKIGGYHPVGRALALGREMQDSGLDIRSGHTVFGVVRDGQRVAGVLSVDEQGYHLFPCRAAIDATGDGDVAAAAGAPMALGRDGDGFPQPYSYTPTLYADSALRHHNFDAGWVDPTDTLDFSRAHFEGRARIGQRGPYDRNRHYCTLAGILGIRESRFALGEIRQTFDDFLEGRTFADTVCSAMAHHDNHAMDYAEESEWSRRHVVMFGLWRFLCQGNVSYRALLPREVEGILMACRALSVDHDLHQLLRMQRDLQVLGEICGVAAAEACKRGISPRELPIHELQDLLAERGIQPNPPQAYLKEDPEPCFADLAAAGPESGLAMWRLSRLDDPSRWDAFFATETHADARFRGAVAAALAGIASAPVIEILRQTWRERVDEPRLGVKSPPRYVVAVLALAELHCEGTADMIEALLRENLSAPDLLLLLRALAVCADPRGVEIVQHFLEETEDEAFPTPLWGVANEAAHPTPFRSFVVIRAVRTLGVLGSRAAADRLLPYTNDPSLLIRRHARRVLAELQPKSVT